MRKFKFKEAHGLELVEEFCARVVADEYDAWVEDEQIEPLNKKQFNKWLKKESDTLYNLVMESVNDYTEFGGVDHPN
jgi:hypothetical protein